MKKRQKSKRSQRPVDPKAQRLNKVLARAGLGSRRDVEELIIQGRVEIDREIVTDLSCKVDPSEVTIKVDGSLIKQERPIYFALNKPPGILSTNRDPSGRMRVIDFVPDKARVFSVGRLDRSSEGLMLLTNDGELAQRLAHPKFNVQKTYFVVVAGVMTKEALARLHKGVYLAEGFARIDGARIRRQRKGSTELEIVLSEGKNREIRRILAKAGHKVVLLRRIAIGSLRLGQLPVGGSRELNPIEVKALYAATTPKAKKSAAKPKPGKGSRPTRDGTASQHEERPTGELGNDTTRPMRPTRKPSVKREAFAENDLAEVQSFEAGFPEFDSADSDESQSIEYGMPEGDFEATMFSDASFQDNDFEDDFDDDEFEGVPFSDFDAGDDDFVGGFSSSSQGKVLAFDDDEVQDAKPKQQKSRRPKNSDQTNSRRSSGSARESTKSRSGEGGSSSRKKSVSRGTKRSSTSKKSGTFGGGKKSSTSASRRPSRNAPRKPTQKQPSTRRSKRK